MAGGDLAGHRSLRYIRFSPYCRVCEAGLHFVYISDVFGHDSELDILEYSSPYNPRT